MIRRLLPLVGVILAITSTAARAETPGLNVTGTHAGQTCWTGTVPNLVLSWGGGSIGSCPADQVQLTLEGLIYSPGETFSWFAASDDGIRIWLNGQLAVDAWYDRACQGSWFTPALPAGWHLIRVEYYENSGGTCLYLGRDTPDGFAWFDGDSLDTGSPLSTTTTAPSTTSTSTSTTTTSLPPTTTSTTSTTSTSTTSTYLPSTTTTTTIQTVQTTTTGVQSTTTYQPATSSSAPSATAPTPTSIQNPSTTSTVPVTTILETPAIPSTIPTTTSTTSTTTTVPAEVISSGEALAEILTAVDELTDDQAETLFTALDEGSLTAAEGEALVAAVQDAPVSIRALFEENVNVFAGATDSYIPLGSTVPVRTRRVIIITTGLLVAMPTSSTRRRP